MMGVLRVATAEATDNDRSQGDETNRLMKRLGPLLAMGPSAEQRTGPHAGDPSSLEKEANVVPHRRVGNA